MFEDYVSLRVLGSRLGLSSGFLKRLADEGKIPFLQVGRQRRFNISQVRAILLKIASAGNSSEEGAVEASK